MRALPPYALLAAAAVLAAALSPTSAAPVPKHLMPPRPAVEGRWELTAWDFGTGAPPLPVTRGVIVIEVTARTLVEVTNPGTVAEQRTAGTLAHDAAMRVLGATDRRSPKCGYSDVAYGYALDGDTLTLAWRSGDDGRFVPADPRGPGKGVYMYVLARAKK